MRHTRAATQKQTTDSVSDNTYSVDGKQSSVTALGIISQHLVVVGGKLLFS